MKVITIALLTLFSLPFIHSKDLVDCEKVISNPSESISSIETIANTYDSCIRKIPMSRKKRESWCSDCIENNLKVEQVSLKKSEDRIAAETYAKMKWSELHDYMTKASMYTELFNLDQSSEHFNCSVMENISSKVEDNIKCSGASETSKRELLEKILGNVSKNENIKSAFVDKVSKSLCYVDNSCPSNENQCISKFSTYVGSAVIGIGYFEKAKIGEKLSKLNEKGLSSYTDLINHFIKVQDPLAANFLDHFREIFKISDLNQIKKSDGNFPKTFDELFKSKKLTDQIVSNMDKECKRVSNDFVKSFEAALCGNNNDYQMPTKRKHFSRFANYPESDIATEDDLVKANLYCKNRKNKNEVEAYKEAPDMNVEESLSQVNSKHEAFNNVPGICGHICKKEQSSYPPEGCEYKGQDDLMATARSLGCKDDYTETDEVCTTIYKIAHTSKYEEKILQTRKLAYSESGDKSEINLPKNKKSAIMSYFLHGSDESSEPVSNAQELHAKTVNKERAKQGLPPKKATSVASNLSNQNIITGTQATVAQAPTAVQQNNNVARNRQPAVQGFVPTVAARSLSEINGEEKELLKEQKRIEGRIREMQNSLSNQGTLNQMRDKLGALKDRLKDIETEKRIAEEVNSRVAGIEDEYRNELAKRGPASQNNNTRNVRSNRNIQVPQNGSYIVGEASSTGGSAIDDGTTRIQGGDLNGLSRVSQGAGNLTRGKGKALTPGYVEELIANNPEQISAIELSADIETIELDKLLESQGRGDLLESGEPFKIVQVIKGKKVELIFKPTFIGDKFTGAYTVANQSAENEALLRKINYKKHSDLIKVLESTVSAGKPEQSRI